MTSVESDRAALDTVRPILQALGLMGGTADSTREAGSFCCAPHAGWERTSKVMAWGGRHTIQVRKGRRHGQLLMI